MIVISSVTGFVLYILSRTVFGGSRRSAALSLSVVCGVMLELWLTQDLYRTLALKFFHP